MNHLLLAFALFSFGSCATVQKNNSEHESAPVPQTGSRGFTVRDLMVCGITRDVSCFLDTADGMVQQQMSGILVQADSEVSKSTGRADEENSPSHLTKIINRLISEVTDLFRDSISGFFKSAKEGEGDEVEETEEENEKNEPDSGVGEARKKKKKGKLIALIKLIILGIVIKAKITLLLKALSAALQVKFFLVALAGLILNAARFYLDLKKGHQPQKVIYYEHAQHQHHYEGDDDWSSSGPGGGGGYWGRSYDEEESSAQDLAYAKQKPYKTYQPYKKNEDASSFSWFG